MSGEEGRLALAVWDTIGEIIHRSRNDLPEPDRDEVERAANALRDDANNFLFSRGSKSRLYPFARDMALAVLDWWNYPSEENFKNLARASKTYEEKRIEH
jgi:hypothetical protein